MAPKRTLKGLLAFSVFPGIPLLIIAVLISVILSMGYWHDTDPKAYDEYVTKALGLSGGTWYSLSSEAEEKIISLGFDPAVVANEIMANRWINETGGEVDMGIQLAILEGESKGGTNLGTCSGLASAAKLSSQEVTSAKWLLEHWKGAGVRDWSEIARQMIKPDYSDYTGHCSAGEIGPNGILPSTGVKICRDGLLSHSDSLVQSCNFFDARVAPYGKNWWLNAIGYKAGQSNEEKFNKLYGWNHSEQYREQLVRRASELNDLAGGWNIDPESQNTYVFTGKGVKKIAVKVLEYVGLLSGEVYAASQENVEVPLIGGFAHPYPGSYLCGYGYGVPVANGIHWGIDLCIGTPMISGPIYAMHSGEVVFSRYLSPSETLAGRWWISGNVVAIEGKDDDGNTIWTAYGHGAKNSIEVKVGDRVEKGQKIMMSGSTGFSSGIHLHLAMKVNGSWVNPANYLVGD